MRLFTRIDLRGLCSRTERIRKTAQDYRQKNGARTMPRSATAVALHPADGELERLLLRLLMLLLVLLLLLPPLPYPAPSASTRTTSTAAAAAAIATATTTTIPPTPTTATATVTATTTTTTTTTTPLLTCCLTQCLGATAVCSGARPASARALSRQEKRHV